jgi:ABC-2 type transport system permease protein
MSEFLWLVRRETWEHRALYVAPLITLGIVLVGLISDFSAIPDGMRALAEHAPDRQHAALAALHLLIAVPFVLVMGIVAGFYALDALYAERRDRSVLFWKSLPVSDFATVLSKLAVILVLVPVITFVATVVAQFVALGVASIAMITAGDSPAVLWSTTPIFANSLLIIYALAVQSLWYLPIYAWILLASAWAPRAVTLWAILPPVGVMLFEQIVLHSNQVAHWLAHRFTGIFPLAFRIGNERVGVVIDGDTIDVPEHLLQVMNPTAVLASPGLWIGLAVAAALIAATVWVRRYRDPS